MIEFQYLELKNRPQFKNQRFDLSHKGVSLVLGYNQKTQSTNGVGKSLFFGELADILTEGEATSASAKKDIVRKGSVKFGVKREGKLYEFEQSYSPRESIAVWVEGEPREYRELKEAKAFMKETVTYSEEDVSSYLYLDLANGVHPLIAGTTTSRKAFFREFFKQIDSLSHIRKIVEAAHSSVAQSGVRAEELRLEIEGMKDIPDPAPLRKKERILSKQREEYSSRLGEVSAARAAWQRIEEAAKEEVDLSPLEALGDDPAEAIKVRRSHLRTKTNELNDYQSWCDENYDLDRKIRQSEKELAKMTAPKGDPRKALEKAHAAYEAAAKEFAEHATKVGDLEVTIKEITYNTARIEKTIAELNEDLGTCPTCGGEYHDADLATRVEKQEAKLKDLRTSLKEAKRELKSVGDPDSTEKTRLLEVSEELSAYVSKLSILERLKRKAGNKPEDPGVTQEWVDKEQAETKMLRQLLDTKEEREEIKAKWLAFPKDIRVLAKSDDYHEEFVRLNDELNAVKLELQSAESAIERKAVMETELAELEEGAKAKKYLDILRDAFTSRKGVEKEMISMACSMLAEQVNKYAKYVFTEDFTFDFEMETNFSITVTRNHGKKPMPSDIRKMSGAEKRLLSLTLVVALLSFVPPKLRPNILILDEPTATMGEENRAAFVRFLPVLNKVIPHLIIITPLKPHEYAHLEPRVFTVVKNGGLSKIQPGVVNVNPKPGGST